MIMMSKIEDDYINCSLKILAKIIAKDLFGKWRDSIESDELNEDQYRLKEKIKS